MERENTMLSCPNCGGNLKFDIPSQQLSCEHCHTLFDPYDFDGKTSDAEESKTFDGDYEVTIFTCPQCGGEILSPPTIPQPVSAVSAEPPRFFTAESVTKNGPIILFRSRRQRNSVRKRTHAV